MADLQSILETIKGLSVVELNDLVKLLEEEFGVSAAAVAAAPAAGAAPAAAAEEEKTEFNVFLKEVGASKIAVIKAVKEITGLGLGESKALVDGAPGMVKEGIGKEEATQIANKLKEAGAVVELQ